MSLFLSEKPVLPLYGLIGCAVPVCTGTGAVYQPSAVGKTLLAHQRPLGFEFIHGWPGRGIQCVAVGVPGGVTDHGYHHCKAEKQRGKA